MRCLHPFPALALLVSGFLPHQGTAAPYQDLFGWRVCISANPGEVRFGLDSPGERRWYGRVSGGQTGSEPGIDLGFEIKRQEKRP